jgi:hypothetical protein
MRFCRTFGSQALGLKNCKTVRQPTGLPNKANKLFRREHSACRTNPIPEKLVNELLIFIAAVLIPALSISCATTVKFQVEHPPLVDLRNINTITVIPLEWGDNGKYNYLAARVTQSLTDGVKKQQKYSFINPDTLKNIDRANYLEYVDVFIVGRITNVESGSRRSTKEEKDGDKVKTKIYVTRTVSVSIEYKYIRAMNNEVLGEFKKTESASETVEDSKESSDDSSEWWVKLLLGIFFPKRTTRDKIEEAAVVKFAYDMNREIFPWTTLEKKKIQESAVKKDEMMNKAKKMVKRKKYFDALMLYKKIYEETGGIAAAYNTAILLEANGQFTDALVLLEDMDSKLLETGLNSPPFMEKEIAALKKLITDLEILNEL